MSYVIFCSSWSSVSNLATSLKRELPGYTGWARPERTLAGHFRVQSVSSSMAISGQQWYIDVKCIECRHGGSQFYLRAYGPSVITGLVEDNGDGSYRMTFYPVDEGTYTVEVVLAFSNPPLTDAFPLGDEPGYEGYLLDGFPLQLQVTSSQASKVLEKTGNDHLPWCDISQLSASEDASILQMGRWVVKDKVRDAYHQEQTQEAKQVSLEGYQNGYNSLGILMGYDSVDCAMFQAEDTGNVLDHCINDSANANVHVIFIGDSVMVLEYRAFNSILQSTNTMPHTRTSVIGTHGGLAKQLDAVIDALREIKDEQPDERRLIIFNSGLHDIAQLCSVKYKSARSEYLGVVDEDFSCVELYRSLLHDLVSFLVDYPAELIAFRTTSAGWMPYGNFGFAWKSTDYQPYSLSPNFVAQMNEVAKDVVETISDRILILDGYYITLPRPDHREINEANDIGKHLVHPGPQVVHAMASIWFNVALRTLCAGSTVVDLDGWLL